MLFKYTNTKKYTDINGSLIPIYLNKFKNFKIKRFFILYGKKNSIRGDHAHKKCTQIFISIKGKVKIEMEKKIKKKIYLNSNFLKIITVPPLTWCKIKFLEKNSIVLVLCDVKYSKKEYIRNYKKFKKIVAKK
tara:strand:- start:269 stop:667 length:399 start_codon:yes stop_codon:yes gene_type:complete